jgi:hypothetical protein
MAAAVVVGLSGVAEAHTGTLGATAVCDTTTGTYVITYSGHTENVPATVGAATFTVGEVVPVGTTISGAPLTVLGNLTPYSFVQSNVPGTTTFAGATAFLAWPNGVKADPRGTIVLAGDCAKTATPVTPSVTASSCTENGDVVSGGITIPTTTGVIYKIGGTTVSGFVPKPAGQYTVTPVAAAGFTLTSSAPLVVTVPAGPECFHKATPVTPTVTQSQCTGLGQSSDAFITIPSTTGVIYKIDGIVAAAGNVVKTPGTYAVTAVAAPGYTLLGTTSWSLTVNAAPDCTQHVTAVTPSVTQAECTGLGTSSDAFLTIPATTGVVYSVDSVVTAAGNVVKTPGTYTVTAAALPGYTLEGTASWPLTVDAAPDCTQHVTPVAASVTQAECTGPGTSTQPFVTIPDTAGVVYAIDGVVATAGDHAAAPGTHTVTATALEGYTLDGVMSWDLVVGDTPDCTVEVGALAVPSVTAAACSGETVIPGTYTIGSSPGVDYLVDGAVKAPGTYDAAEGTTVHVAAVAQQGYELAANAVSSWTLQFPDKTCVLGEKTTKPPVVRPVTLPTTGTSSGLLVLSGLAALAAGGALTFAGSRSAKGLIG